MDCIWRLRFYIFIFMINIFQPSLGEDELQAIREVFASNWLAKGKKTEAFEAGFAEHHRVTPVNMVSTTCATEGLFSILELLNLNRGDEVIMPSIGFVATPSAVFSVGARPVFCDVDPRTLNARVEDIDVVRTDKTRAVLMNHYGGYPAEVDKISSYCEEHNLILIEDAACAIASSINGKMVGTFGHSAVWSFDAMKVLVSADGGMIYCRDEIFAEQMREHLYLGLMSGSKTGLEKSKSTKDRWWEYQVSEFGRRAIMNDVTASMGLVQLSKLDGFLKRRADIAKRYDDAFHDIDGLVLPPALRQGDVMTHYFYWLQLENRDELASYLLEKGVYTTFRYWPLHKVKKFDHNPDIQLSNSNRVAEVTINIPIHHGLTDDEVETIIYEVKSFFKKKS